MKWFACICLILFSLYGNAQTKNNFEGRLLLGFSSELGIHDDLDSHSTLNLTTGKPIMGVELCNQILNRFNFSAILSYHVNPYNINKGATIFVCNKIARANLRVYV